MGSHGLGQAMTKLFSVREQTQLHASSMLSLVKSSRSLKLANMPSPASNQPQVLQRSTQQTFLWRAFSHMTHACPFAGTKVSHAASAILSTPSLSSHIIAFSLSCVCRAVFNCVIMLCRRPTAAAGKLRSDLVGHCQRAAVVQVCRSCSK